MEKRISFVTAPLRPHAPPRTQSVEVSLIAGHLVLLPWEPGSVAAGQVRGKGQRDPVAASHSGLPNVVPAGLDLGPPVCPRACPLSQCLIPDRAS